MPTFDTKLAAQAQEKYCNDKHYPMFAPSNGRCYRCHTNIFEPINGMGFSVEEAGCRLITGCPHCHFSFCD